MHAIEAVRTLLQQPQHIIITTHQRPDGDAMGSSLALYHVLAALGHQVCVITPTEFPDYLKWLPAAGTVVVEPQQPQQAARLVQQATLFFCLDFNQLYRNGNLGLLIARSAKPKVLIDHHLDPEDAFTCRFWDPQASSTSEMVYRFLTELGELSRLNEPVATCLYAGLLADTDRFRIPTTSAAVHRLAAHLLEAGVEHEAVYRNLYENFSRRRLQLFGHCLANRLLLPEHLPVGIVWLEPADMDRFSVQPGDTEGLVNYPLLVADVRVSALITPNGTGSRLSLRSKGNISVEAICRQHFGGGGHFNAAGGNSPLPVLQTVEQLVAILAALKIQELVQ